MSGTTNETERPTKLSVEARAERTNTIARDILDAEARARAKKTERLRALRLEQSRQPAAR